MTGYIVLLLFLLIGVAAIAYLVHRHGAQTKFLSAHDKSVVHVKWHAIEQRMQKGGPTNFRQAVMEADSLVDYVLKQLGVEGTTMGERLRASQPRYSDYQGLWNAHKLRNEIVHELDRDVHSSEAKTAIARFQTALYDLGAV